MQIILKVKTQFFVREKRTDKDGNEILAVTNTVTLNPSNAPQTVPDWIANDPYFKLLVNDGSVVQVPAIEQAEKPAAAQTTETAQQSNDKKESK